MKNPILILVALGCMAAGAALLSAQAGTPAVRPDIAQVQDSQVLVGDSLVFTYTQGLGPFSPQERARRLQAALDSLAHDSGVDLANFSVRDRENETDLLLGNRVLMTLTEADATVEGLSRKALADQVLGRLSLLLHQEAQRYTFKMLAKSAALGLLFTNQAVLGDHIVNYSAAAQEHGLVLHTTVTIGYDTPWRQVHALLLAAAAQTTGLMKTPAPFVLQKSLDDFYVSYELNAYTDRPNEMNALYSALHQQIQDRFSEGGVQIMSPHFERQPERPVLPGEYPVVQQAGGSQGTEKQGGR